MSISGKSGYLSTVDSFLNHWVEANGLLGTEGPLVVRTEDGSTINLPGLQSRRAVMETSLSELQVKVVDATETRQILNYAQRAILFRSQSFVRAIRSDYQQHVDFRRMPECPQIRDDSDHFTRSLKAFVEIWKTVNALPTRPALLLPGRYGIAEYETELANLQDIWWDAETARVSLLIKQEERDSVLAPIAGILSHYQNTARSMFAHGSEILERLPEIYSTSGYLPEPIKAAGIWDPIKEMGRITWECSKEPGEFHYELRYSPGDRYDSDVESLIAIVEKSAPKSWLTMAGLREKGRSSLFRVYVVLPTGNEAASETILITNGNDDD